jgi:hypothetical protein
LESEEKFDAITITHTHTHTELLCKTRMRSRCRAPQNAKGVFNVFQWLKLLNHRAGADALDAITTLLGDL